MDTVVTDLVDFSIRNVFTEDKIFTTPFDKNGVYDKTTAIDECKFPYIDKKTGKLHHRGKITENHWIKANKSYFIDWSITINKNNGEEIYNIDLDLKDKRVFICFDSSSLGDNLAQLPSMRVNSKGNELCKIPKTFFSPLTVYARDQVLRNRW